jgi:hypothetical protein
MLGRSRYWGGLETLKIDGLLSVQIITLTAALAAIGSFMFDAASHSREWRASYKRVTGLILLALGALTLLLALNRLWKSDLSAVSPTVVWPAAAAVAGLVVSAIGVIRFIRAPVSPEVASLRVIARAVNAHLDRLNDLEGAAADPYVQLVVGPSSRSRRNRRSLLGHLSRPRSPVTLLTGAAGAGKTSLVRFSVREINRKVLRKRRPSRIAVYVNLADLEADLENLTPNALRALMARSLSNGDETVADLFLKVWRDAADRPEWLLFLDSMDDAVNLHDPASSEQTWRDYLYAIEQMLNGGPKARAVLSCRDSAPLDFAPLERLSVLPLSLRQQEEMLKAGGLSGPAYQRALRWIRSDGALPGISDNPLMLTLLGGHLRHLPVDARIPGTLFDILDEAIRSRLADVGGESAPTGVVCQVAEYLAQHTLTDAQRGKILSVSALEDAVTLAGIPLDVPMGSAISMLTDARIGRLRRGTFIFSHRTFHDYFAARWLIGGGYAKIDLQTRIGQPQWSNAMVLAFEKASDEFRSTLVNSATSLIMADISSSPVVVKDAGSYLAVEPDDPLPVLGSGFSWSPSTYQVMRTLVAAYGQRVLEIPDKVRELADRLIVSSFVAGTRLDQKKALEMVPAGGMPVSVWALERAAISRSGLLSEAAAEGLSAASNLLSAIRPRFRVRLLASGFVSPGFVVRALRGGNPVDVTVIPTLSSVVYDLLRAGQIFAPVLALISVQDFVSELSSAHSLVVLATEVLLVLVSATFLLQSLSPRTRLVSKRGRVSAVVMGVAAVAYCIKGLVYFLSGLINLATLDLGGAILSLLLGYVYTWPAFMIAYIGIGPRPEVGDWILPQKSVIQLVSQFPEVATSLAELRSRWRTFALWTGVSVLIIVAATIPLPFIVPEKRPDARGWILVSIALGSWLFSLGRGRWRRYGAGGIARRIAKGVVVEGDVLEWFNRAGTQESTARLLKTLADRAPGSALQSIDEIRDLAAALEHVDRIVPRATTNVIPAGVWEVGPDFRSRRFLDWLVAYDKRHPGRLSWMAASHRDDMARLLERAETVASGGFGTTQRKPQ